MLKGLQKLPLYKRLLAQVVPVLLRKEQSPENPLLELYFYRGRYQLATADALYSDGEHYTPLKLGFKHIKKQLPDIKSVLVLGTGLGSAVQVMTKMGFSPDFTLVEYDNTVLKWAMEVMPPYAGAIKPICTNAQHFMLTNTDKYDLLVLDIFISRVVPAFATTEEFLTQCRNSINAGGKFIFNYIIQEKEEWHRVDAILRGVFPKCYCIDDGINRIIIATV